MSEAEKPSFAELALLRGFYSAWTEFHSIPRTNIHRNQKEAAAQVMVDAHHSLMLFYSHHAKPAIVLATVDGNAVEPANA